GANPISSRVDAYRRSIRDSKQQLGRGFAAIAGFTATAEAETSAANCVVINPWNVAGTQFVGADFLQVGDGSSLAHGERAIGVPDASYKGPLYLPDMPGCGYATFASAASPPPVALVEKFTLRNEWLE